MKQYLIIAGILTITSCKSNEKQKEQSRVKNHSITTTTAPPVTSPIGKIDIESFGDIKIGQLHTETIKAIGNPGTKSKAEEWGSDGLLHEDWTWKDKGLVLNISSDKNTIPGSLAIFSISASASCTFKTKAGMGIGNSYTEVQEAYKRDMDATATDKEQITVGSIYGGIIFTFKNDKVVTVFIGTAAE